MNLQMLVSTWKFRKKERKILCFFTQGLSKKIGEKQMQKSLLFTLSAADL